ncbi:hypothetical protein RJ640_000491, partial [Escallonia rubra]
LSVNRQGHQRPAIAVIECPNVHLMKSGVRALDDFPCVCIPSNARDSQYQALGWQIVAAKVGMQRCAASSQWLNERILLSRYAHVPLGNIELDWLIHTADIFFARALRHHQQVLWISDNGIPDLGGISEEESCYADEVNQPVLTYPGAYRKVTVELKIHNIAVSALLKSNQVNEMEGGTLLGLDQDSNTGPYVSNEQCGFDEATSCAPAFRVLKQLIQRCIKDAVDNGNVYADAILQHLYRWLCSPQSKLHDPALHRMLHKVMQKIFALLLAEFRKLGATIVFANFSKVIIDTGKSDLSAAKAYSDSLLRTLQTRDLFEWIELEPLQFWHSLLFMDQYNYGGIQAKGNGGSAQGSSSVSTESLHDDECQVDIVSSWSVAETLPKETQDHFILIVSEYMYLPWKYVQEKVAIRACARGDNMCTPSITAAAAETLESCLSEYLREQISSYFTDKLLRIVRDAKAMSKAHPAHTGDPALEFVKHVCAVLALDQNVQHDILIMRKNLLRYVRVREFAPEAEFHNHSIALVLPNVICSPPLEYLQQHEVNALLPCGKENTWRFKRSVTAEHILQEDSYESFYCNDCRDLDLCRDRALLAQEWHCAVPQCGQPYDREVMENAFLQIVRQRERLYHLQDLVCLKCNQVKAAHLAEHCACAGSFRCKEDASEFRNKMQVFFHMAKKQSFQLLLECTAWILSENKARSESGTFHSS